MPTKISVLEKKATVIVAGEDEVDLCALMNELGAMGIHRIMVEGGGTLIAGLIEAGLVNEIYTFIGNIIIGGKDAPTLYRRGRVYSGISVSPSYASGSTQD